MEDEITGRGILEAEKTGADDGRGTLGVNDGMTADGILDDKDVDTDVGVIVGISGMGILEGCEVEGLTVLTKEGENVGGELGDTVGDELGLMEG